MPELPEVETIARELDRMVAGSIITGVRIIRPDVLRRTSPRSFGRRLMGATIARCWRRAKLVVVDLSSGDKVAIQPRFTGALLVEGAASPLPERERRYSTLYLELGDGRRVHYCDVRRLGTVTLMSAADFEAHSGGLGVEPLAREFTPTLLSGLLRASRQAVKKLMMDQSRIAGVGNIYANEALWRARIDPSREARLITTEEAAELHRSIRGVLMEAIAARGTSFRDYRSATGDRGDFAMKLDAYGRAGKPCRRCGGRLVGTHAIDGRATVLCPYCQS